MKTQPGPDGSPIAPPPEATKTPRNRTARKLAAATIGLLLAGTSLPAVAQTFLFDFGGAATTLHGPSPDDPIGYWNNVLTEIGASDTGRLTNLVTSLNSTSAVSL